MSSEKRQGELGPSLTKELKAHLARNRRDLVELVEALIREGKRGKPEALKQIFDRVDGKLVETHQIESENPVTLVFVPASQLNKINVVSTPPVLGALETETIPQHGLDETSPPCRVDNAVKAGLAMLPAPPKTVVGQPWTGDGTPPGWTRTRVERSNNE